MDYTIIGQIIEDLRRIRIWVVFFLDYYQTNLSKNLIEISFTIKKLTDNSSFLKPLI